MSRLMGKLVQDGLVALLPRAAAMPGRPVR